MVREIDAPSVLASCPLFAGAAGDDLEALAEIARTTQWPPGTLIFQRGDPPSFLLIIASGRVRLTLTSLSGKELTLRHAERGATVGEMGVLDGEPRSADATAVGHAKALVIHREPFERVLAQRPGLSLTVIRYLTTRLRETTYQLESVALYDLEARLARFLLATLHQTHGEMLPETVSLPLLLGQAEIASVLGASRPKVNRAFASLAEQGAIVRKSGELDCNTSLLSGIAEPDGD
jgi:CRP/FNR family transcriptional regulator, cyclic AMP receptor protein